MVKATEELTNGLKLGNEARELINEGLKTKILTMRPSKARLLKLKVTFQKL